MHIAVVQLDCCGEHSPFRCGPYEWYSHLGASQESLVQIAAEGHKHHRANLRNFQCELEFCISQLRTQISSLAVHSYSWLQSQQMYYLSQICTCSRSDRPTNPLLHSTSAEETAGAWPRVVGFVRRSGQGFDSVPRDVLWAVLAKMGVPAHLIHVIKRMNADLKVTFDLNGEPVEVSWAKSVGLAPSAMASACVTAAQ